MNIAYIVFYFPLTSSWSTDVRDERKDEIIAVYKHTLRKVQTTIQKGPVQLLVHLRECWGEESPVRVS